MKQSRSVFLRTVLVGSTGWACSAERPLPNGVYAVLAEGATPDQIREVPASSRVLRYDDKYSDAGRRQPPRYIALDAVAFVPLILEGPPEASKSERGWTMLSVTLERKQVKSLEDLTRTHLGGRVAIVLDGEIVTLHKVRSIITDGKAKVTRCTDDACRTLLLKLKK